MRSPSIPPPSEVRLDGAPAFDDHGRDQSIGLQPVVPGDRRISLRPGFPRMEGIVPADGLAHFAARSVPCGWEQPSRPRSPHGGNFRTAGGSLHHCGPRFDCPVPRGGYAWWYIDAISDDGAHALTFIAFVGSVFSPYYAWARRRGNAEPLNHCAFNLAVYGPRSGRWAMTERGARQVSRERTRLSFGPSAVHWADDALQIEIDEICTPLPVRLRGSIRLVPSALSERSFPLDPAGLHRWAPIAPRARIEVRLSHPALNWTGTGYCDSNFGAAALEDSFESWNWSRASLPDRTVVLYDFKARECGLRSMALEFDRNGEIREMEAPPEVSLPCTRWRVARRTRADAGTSVEVVKTLEDGPFYSRSQLDTTLRGTRAPAIHESLSLDRFRSRWVQFLLPFRMPRITRRRIS
jgi:carotenoid 1,2-hydratase